MPKWLCVVCNAQTTHKHAQQPSSNDAQQADADSHAQHATDTQEQRHRRRDRHRRHVLHSFGHDCGCRDTSADRATDAVHAQAAERHRSACHCGEAY